ncbi:sperm acrosome membrane-associated protein 6 isoform X2 [Pantherophis guttatus]|uniref:Sperm acrosome membrane-associated protein 6 isoform X2 n=1 Tax=Pantherophis guttatus TaxID=94885 RepID=A0A6P9DEU5_PANGU|nr:sperm acrosome membrane-associated protein 6 isoform X2 [Pantherophis guttatus]
MTPGKNSFLRGLFLETSVMSGGDVLFLWLVFSSRATACLNCFSTAAQRLRICQYFWGYQSEKHQTCLGTLESAFRPLSKTQVDVSEIEKLKDAFGRVVFYLEEKGMAKAPFQEAVPEAVNEVEKEIAQLKAGKHHLAFHHVAIRKNLTTTDVPLVPSWIASYPLIAQDIHKLEGDATFLNCEVAFQTSSDRTFRWKFVKDLRTEELFLFHDLNFGVNPSLLIRPTLGSHHGTFACELEEENDVVVRKYFYVNVTEKRLGNEKKLQEMFKAILNSPPESVQEAVVVNKLPSLQDLMSQPDYLRKRGVIVLILGITGISLLVTLAVLSLYRWATDFGP